VCVVLVRLKLFLMMDLRGVKFSYLNIWVVWNNKSLTLLTNTKFAFTTLYKCIKSHNNYHPDAYVIECEK
jgi:hypothetical protein